MSAKELLIRERPPLKKMRLILGAALSPLVPPGLYFLGMRFVSGYTQQGPGHMDKLVNLALGFTMLSYALSLALGASTILLLVKLKRLTIRHLLAWSFAAGFLAGLGFDILIYWPDQHEIVITVLAFGVIGGVCGLSVAATFCVTSGLSSGGPRRWEKKPVLIFLGVLAVGAGLGIWWLRETARTGAETDAAIVEFKKGNYTEAAQRLIPLAENGNDAARQTLGIMYAFGYGVARNRESAVSLLKDNPRAASMFLWFGQRFEQGDGVGVDRAEAAAWYELAAEAGNEDAKGR